MQLLSGQRWVCVLALLLAAAAGCKSEAKRAGAEVPNPFEIDRAEYPRMFQAAQDVLHHEGFTLERRDYRFGQVDTTPLVAPTGFEPWRTSNTTGYQRVAATVNHQRRVAVVSIVPAGDPRAAMDAKTQATDGDAALESATTQTVIVEEGEPQTYLLRVEVQLQELQVPNRNLSGTTRGPRVQGHLRSVPAELAERGIQGPYWLPIGRDPFLEQRLLASIVRKSMKVDAAD